ncbi:glycerophosphodiester phosphodiesterase family protein [Salegentibacter sediminis]|uniref:glycerophosphodiester phosphodiesterase family protein n=1 Tax=Salegentibacter sediminis TaxID=1930251 RepID=UPI0009BE51CC|nr:glycerophosphodiester phosphodiesterase family protein [Salegentibacter sediminis]
MKLLSFLNLLVAVLIISSCKSTQERESESTGDNIQQNNIQVQGHRGDRGSYPENTIRSFYSAIEKGANVIELDVVISGDNKVVVSHEPYMHSLYMLDPSGDSIPEADQKKYNFYTMAYDSIRKFDAGSKGNKLFPDQKAMASYKPLLSELIDSVETFIQKHNYQPIKYNIELKSGEKHYGKFQPFPEEFVNLVMAVVSEKKINDFSNIQSFDTRILNYLNKAYPEMEVGYLISGVGIPRQLAKLDFKPDNYNPYFGLVESREFVDSVKALDMKLIPWTVNTQEDISRMIELEVDGIITDYPERVIEKLH